MHAVHIKSVKQFTPKDVKFKDTSISMPVGFWVQYSESEAVLSVTTSRSKQVEGLEDLAVPFTEKLQEVHLERT